MEGVSSHYDHLTNRHVMGQQVLTLGLATDETFLPLDSQSVLVWWTIAVSVSGLCVSDRYEPSEEMG